MTDWDEHRDGLIDRLSERVTDEDVLDAMRSVPRHAFVPESQRADAYADRPLRIGEGQTVSAPHMVAVMADLLDLRGGDDVLEIGTGCGYHAAVTAELVGDDHVYSVEYHDELAEDTRERFAELGYDDISIRIGDGTEGWAEQAPYDRAYLTCAAPEFPDAVVDQVRPEGVVLGPIGTGRQTLIRGRRRADGRLDRESHGGVRFVRMQ